MAGGDGPDIPNYHGVDLEGMGEVDPADYGIEMEAEPEYQYGKIGFALC